MKKKTSARLWVIASLAAFGAMLGLSFAAAPLYGMFCRVTGYGGTTSRAEAAPKRVLERKVEVRFDTNVAPGVPLEFTADKPKRTLKIGETALVFFRVKNIGDEPIQAVATYNVSPYKVGTYFQKLECFCFEPHVFEPGQSQELPVVFFVDPRIVDDQNTKEVQQITLSYTYFRDPKAKPLETADASAGGDLGRDLGRDVARP
jgi:cytochrome c oxidase assembly protein subunit 11